MCNRRPAFGPNRLPGPRAAGPVGGGSWHTWTTRFELLLGYAEWAPHQLEGELERGDWLQADLDPELLFDVVVAKRWDEVWTRLGVNPFGFMAVRGGAQA